jgi:hypothetical protein
VVCLVRKVLHETLTKQNLSPCRARGARKNKYTASAKKKRPPFGERNFFRWKLATTQRSRKPIVKFVFALCAQWVNLRNVLDLDFRVALVALCFYSH